MTNSERAYRLRKKQRQYAEVAAYKKDCGCRDCGSHGDDLDLHHLDPNTKISDVSTMISKSANWITVLTEVQKCVVLCVSCHRRIHYGVK